MKNKESFVTAINDDKRLIFTYNTTLIKFH